MGNSSVTGSYEYNVICKVCGFKYKASQTRKRWDGLEPVCTDCWEPRHPLDFYRPRNDTHKLPFISAEIDNSYTFFPPLFDKDLDWDLDTNDAGPGTTETWGNRFTVLSNGYITEVLVHMGGTEGDIDPLTLFAQNYLVRIWNHGGADLLWSTTAKNLKQGWNSIQVIPNIQAVTTVESYTVGIDLSPSATISSLTEATVGTIAAQRYLQLSTSYKNATGGFPSTATTDFVPLTVTIRPD